MSDQKLLPKETRTSRELRYGIDLFPYHSAEVVYNFDLYKDQKDRKAFNWKFESIPLRTEWNFVVKDNSI